MRHDFSTSTPVRPKIGDTAPWSTGVVDHTGRPIILDDLRGRTVLIYFYPRDQTTGCVLPTYGLAHGRMPGLPVLAISLDGPEGQREFLERTGDQCRVVNDNDGVLRRSYGLPEDLVGHHYAFLVGADGRIFFTWSGIDVDGLWKKVSRIGSAVVRHPTE